MAHEIINKIDKAGLITLDVQSLIPNGQRKVVDLIDWLDEGQIIREDSFKKKLRLFDFSVFENTFVAIRCSKDVIIPPWVYLLIQMKLRNIAKQVFFCELSTMNFLLFQEAVHQLKIEKYKNKRVFLKVCAGGQLPVGYLSLCVHVLSPHVKSLFYGEPCSNIPLIKN